MENPCYTRIMLVMPRKKTKTLTSVRINSHLLARLDELAERIGRTRSDLIDRAIEEFVDRHDEERRTTPQPTRPRKA